MLLDLKRVAKLSTRDRLDLIRSLKSGRKNRDPGKVKLSRETVEGVSLSAGSSFSSVNKNEWTNWMIFHGNPKQVEEDISAVGKVTRAKYDGECSNKFSVLSKGSEKGEKVGDKVK